MDNDNDTSISWYPGLDDDRSKQVFAAFEDIGGTVVANGKIERRGVQSEVWMFLLQTDWAVVRDTVVATALASGAPAGMAALKRGAEVLISRFRKVEKAMPENRDGFISIRDTRTGIEIKIPADSIQEEKLWLSLLGQDLPSKPNWIWNPDTKKWQAPE
jgi:hypothetical protein